MIVMWRRRIALFNQLLRGNFPCPICWLTFCFFLKDSWTCACCFPSPSCLHLVSVSYVITACYGNVIRDYHRSLTCMLSLVLILSFQSTESILSRPDWSSAVTVFNLFCFLAISYLTVLTLHGSSYFHLVLLSAVITNILSIQRLQSVKGFLSHNTHQLAWNTVAGKRPSRSPTSSSRPSSACALLLLWLLVKIQSSLVSFADSLRIMQIRTDFENANGIILVFLWVDCIQSIYTQSSIYIQYLLSEQIINNETALASFFYLNSASSAWWIRAFALLRHLEKVNNFIVFILIYFCLCWIRLAAIAMRLFVCGDAFWKQVIIIIIIIIFLVFFFEF